MEDYIQFSAKTKNEAITKACMELGTSSDQLDIQVVSEGSSGFFGIGSKPAIIKVRKKVETVSDDVELEKILDYVKLDSIKEEKKPEKPKPEAPREKKEKKEFKGPKPSKEPKEPKEPRENKEAGELKEVSDMKVSREPKEARELKEKQPKPPKEKHSREKAPREKLPKEKTDKEPKEPKEIREEKEKAPKEPKEKPVKDKQPKEKPVKVSKPVEIITDPEVIKQVEESAVVFLRDVFAAMDLGEVEIVSRYNSTDGCLEVAFEGEDMGILIGKRGQTLDSLQYLTSLVVNKGKAAYK